MNINEAVQVEHTPLMEARQALAHLAEQAEKRLMAARENHERAAERLDNAQHEMRMVRSALEAINGDQDKVQAMPMDMERAYRDKY